MRRVAARVTNQTPMITSPSVRSDYDIMDASSILPWLIPVVLAASALLFAILVGNGTQCFCSNVYIIIL